MVNKRRVTGGEQEWRGMLTPAIEAKPKAYTLGVDVVAPEKV